MRADGPIAGEKTVTACQTALAKRGVAVLIVPADIAPSVVDDSIPYAVHVARPVTRPNDADLAEIAEILNKDEETHAPRPLRERHYSIVRR